MDAQEEIKKYKQSLEEQINDLSAQKDLKDILIKILELIQ